METIWISSVHLCFVSLLPYLHGLKSARSAHLCFTSVDIKSSRWFIWGVFWCVPWVCLYFSDNGFSDIDWWALLMQYNIFSYNCASFCFFSCKSWSKKSDDFWKSIMLFSNFFAMLTDFWCSTLFNAVVFFWKKNWSQFLYMPVEGSLQPWIVFLACID